MMHVSRWRKFGLAVTGIFCANLLVPLQISSAADRAPSVAGVFYPGTQEALAEKIDTLLDKEQKVDIPGKIVALLAPHAGYDYSGWVAAVGFKQLEGLKPERIVVLGPSHFVHFNGFSIGMYDHYLTPLGKVRVDKALAKTLSRGSPSIRFVPLAHEREHAIEVELPFLQSVFKEENFSILPIVTGNTSREDMIVLSALLGKMYELGALIILSADLSHYYSYERAVEMDTKAVEAIAKADIDALIAGLNTKEIEIDAQFATLALLYFVKNIGAKGMILRYANSGDVASRKKVVGYTSIIFYLPQ